MNWNLQQMNSSRYKYMRATERTKRNVKDYFLRFAASCFFDVIRLGRRFWAGGVAGVGTSIGMGLRLGASLSLLSWSSHATISCTTVCIPFSLPIVSCAWIVSLLAGSDSCCLGWIGGWSRVGDIAWPLWSGCCWLMVWSWARAANQAWSFLVWALSLISA